MLSGRVYLCRDHNFITRLADTPIESAILVLLISPLCFCRIIHLTCSSSSLCITLSLLPFLNRVLIFVRRSWDDPHTIIFTLQVDMAGSMP